MQRLPTWLPFSKHSTTQGMSWALSGGSRPDPTPQRPQAMVVGRAEGGPCQQTSGLRESVQWVGICPAGEAKCRCFRRVMAARAAEPKRGPGFSSQRREKRSGPQRRQQLGKVLVDQGNPHMGLLAEKCTPIANCEGKSRRAQR